MTVAKRTVQQTWPPPPMNLWTQAYADMLTGKIVHWVDGEQSGRGPAVDVQVLDGGEYLLVTIEVDETMIDPPF